MYDQYYFMLLFNAISIFELVHAFISSLSNQRIVMEDLRVFGVASEEPAVNAHVKSANDDAQNTSMEAETSQEAQKSVLCINICNDVYHSVPVECLNKDNK